eukprot:TRINITY_DN141_c0_g1_i1.p1 TRINITY_DN141_c0_g1~~TRINITY_DN141_c0_g1_i1.p1  ORF type:complete len:591 (-),score=120.27 TRINITY_DN141_c0_g1_i1:27-1742(-)
MSGKDLFFSLTNGAKFDRKKFVKDIVPFQKIESSKKITPAHSTSLDYFKTSQKSQPDADAESKRGVKRQVDKNEEIEENEQPTNTNDFDEDEDEDEDDIEGDKANKTELTHTQIKKKINTRAYQMNLLRKTHKIYVKGTDAPDPVASFDELLDNKMIRKYLHKNILNAEFSSPTPIQMQAIPIMIKRRDLVALAPTGSGKTLSYVAPMLAILKKPEKQGFRGLVLCPTRELAIQIHHEFVKFAKGKEFRIHVLSKVKSNVHQYNEQTTKLDILIATPLKLIYLIQQNSINLSTVQVLVLDEADKLFELGFVKQIDEILHACTNSKKQIALFSATISPEVEDLAKTVMHDHLQLHIGKRGSAADTIKQKLVYTGTEEGKTIAFRQLIAQGIKPPILVFVQSRERALSLFREMVYDGITVDIITADRTLPQRDLIVKNFRLGKLWVLIATDLMARGMDFKGINYIINYDFPQTIAQYIHRVGRTGRAGRTGESITFFNDEDLPLLRDVASVMQKTGCEVPEWIFKTRRISGAEKKKLQYQPVVRETISTEHAPEYARPQKRKRPRKGDQKQKD